ncbi:hypothetical protein ABMB68_006882 [Bradyrhizobium sp. RT4a]
MIAPASVPNAAIAASWPGRSISRARPRGLAGVAPAQPQAGKTDRQVDQEDRAPADQRDQCAADEGTGSERQARSGGPDRHGAATRAGVHIGMIEQRQGIRHQDRRRQPLHQPRCDQHDRIGRHRAGERGRGEDGEPRHEDALGADAIAERTGGQNESGKGDGIGADHPLQLGDAAAERFSHRIQSGVDDGDVELDHAIAEAHRGKREGCRKARAGTLRSGSAVEGFIFDGAGSHAAASVAAPCETYASSPHSCFDNDRIMDASNANAARMTARRLFRSYARS